MAAREPVRTAFTDAELMELVDGELPPARAREVADALARGLGDDAAAASKVAGVRELGELVRGHLELSADAHEARLANMWNEIDKQLTLQAEPAAAIATPAAMPETRSRFALWLQRYRGHMLTGVLSAGAVAAIAIATRPSARSARPAAVALAPVVAPPVVATPALGGGGAGPVMAVALPRVAPMVESVDAARGSSMVFTIEDEDGGTAVVWVTPDDTVEGL